MKQIVELDFLFVHFQGVVETGLFLNMISKAYFGNSDGNVEIKINSRLA